MDKSLPEKSKKRCLLSKLSTAFSFFAKIFPKYFQGFDKSESGESKFGKTIREVGVAVIQSLVNNFVMRYLQPRNLPGVLKIQKRAKIIEKHGHHFSRNAGLKFIFSNLSGIRSC
jgi:hypothetical protein